MNKDQRPFEKGERVEVLFFDEAARRMSVIAGELGAFNHTHAELRFKGRDHCGLYCVVVETDMLRRPMIAEEAA